MDTINYGLALAGGGTRGAAHVGVLAALEEEGLLPGKVAGASAGSIVAGIYASGLEISDMKDVIRWLDRRGLGFIDPNICGLLLCLPQLLLHEEVTITGLIKGNRLKRLFCDLTGGVDIAGTELKILIPAVDLKSGDTIVFTNMAEGRLPSSALRLEHVRWETSGRLCDVMMASSSVPAIFSPQKIGDYCLVDGGVTNNLPVDLMIAAGEKNVIAVDIGTDYKMPHDHSIVEIASHSFSIMSRELKDCKSSGEILLLKPELPSGAGLLTFDHMIGCMEAGYSYTKRMMPRIKKVLVKHGI